MRQCLEQMGWSGNTVGSPHRKSALTMLHTVYTPNDVAEICYLNEALLWVALGRVPLAEIGPDGCDLRQHKDFTDGLVPGFTFSPVSHEECARAGIPPNPEWDDFEESYGYIFPDHSESKSVPRKQADWNAEFDYFLDRHRTRLFLALSDGTLSAQGKKLPKPTFRASADVGRTSDGSTRDIDWEPIPADFWISRGISYSDTWADGRNSAFCMIFVPCKQLFECFAARAEKADGVIKIGGVFAPPSGAKVRSLSGRPVGRPPYDWDTFHVEVARRLLKQELPDKQEAFIAEMLEWCKSNWPKAPSRTAVLQKVKPYYDAFITKDRNSRGKNF